MHQVGLPGTAANPDGAGIGCFAGDGSAVLDKQPLAAWQDPELIHGQTDSERMFALITAEIRRRDGDVTAGLVAAISWIGETLPVYALNLVLSTSTDLWALR